MKKLLDLEEELEAESAIESTADSINKQIKETEEGKREDIEISKVINNSLVAEPPTIIDALRVGSIRLDNPENLNFAIEPEVPVDSNLADQFLSGVLFDTDAFGIRESLGIDVDDPETFSELASNLTGNLAGGVILALGARFGANKLPLSMLGKHAGTGRFIARAGIETTGVAGLTPEDDLLQQGSFVFGAEALLNTTRGRNLLKRTAAVFNIAKADKSKSVIQNIDDTFKKSGNQSTIGKELDKIEASPEAPVTTASPKFQEKVTKLSNLSREVDGITKQVDADVAKELEDLKVTLRGKDKSFDDLVTEVSDFSDNALDEVVEAFTSSTKFSNRAFTKQQLEIVESVLDRTENLSSMSGAKLKDLFKKKLGSSFDIGDVRPSGVQPLSKNIDEALTEFVRKIDTVETKFRAQLGPNSNIDDAIKNLDEIIEKTKDLEKTRFTAPRIGQIKEEINNVVEELLDDPEKLFSTEFPTTAEFSQVMKFLTSNLTEDFNTKQFQKLASELGTVAKKASSNKISDEVVKDIERISTVFSEGEELALKEIDAALRSSDPTAIDNLSDLSKGTVTRFFVKFVEGQSDELLFDIGSRNFRLEAASLIEQQVKTTDPRLLNQIESQLKQLRADFIDDVLSNPQTIEQFFSSTSDTAFQRLGLLFKGLAGDKEAIKEIRHIDRVSDLTVEHNLLSNQAFANLNKAVGGEINIGQHLEDVRTIPAWRRWAVSADRLVKNINIPILTNAYESLLDSQLVHERFVREGLRPLMNSLVKEFNKVPKKFQQQASNVIRQVDTRASELIDEGADNPTIQKAIDDLVNGQPDEVKNLYNIYRKTADDALDYFNSHIRQYNRTFGLKGDDAIKEVERRPGWFPHLWDSDYRIKIIDDVEGEKIIGHANNNREAVKILSKYKNDNPSFTGRLVLEPRIMATPVDDLNTLPLSINETDRLYSISADELRKAFDKGEVRPETIQQLVFGNRFNRSSNLDDFITDPLRSLELYLHSGAKFSHYLVPLRKMKLASKFLDESTGADNVVLKDYGNYFRSLANSAVGRRGNLEQSVDAVLGSAIKSLNEVPVLGGVMKTLGFGPNTRPSRAVNQALLTFGRFATIGFNPSTAIINMSILATNVAPIMGGSRLFNASIKFGKRSVRKNPRYKNLFDRAGLNIIEGGAALQDITTSPTILQSRANKLREWTDAKSMWAFNKTENAARSITLIAARDEADTIAAKLAAGKTVKGRKGQLYQAAADKLGLNVADDAVKDQFALDIMRETNFNFNKAALPSVFRVGPLQPFLQFKTYLTKEMEFLFDLGKNDKVALAKTMGMFGMLGGIFGIPGANMLDVGSRAVFGFSPKLWMQERVPDVFTGGVPRFFGVDVSQRLTIDDMQFLLDPGNAFGIAPYKAYEASLAAFRGDTQRAGAILAPPALRSAMNTIELMSDGAVRSDFSSEILIKQEDLSKPFMQTLALAFGFEPDVLRDIRSVRSLATIQKRKLLRSKKLAINNAAKALIAGDVKKAKKIANEGDVTFKQVRARVKTMNLSSVERIKQNLPEELRDQEELDIPRNIR